MPATAGVKLRRNGPYRRVSSDFTPTPHDCNKHGVTCRAMKNTSRTAAVALVSLLSAPAVAQIPVPPGAPVAQAAPGPAAPAEPVPATPAAPAPAAPMPPPIEAPPPPPVVVVPAPPVVLPGGEPLAGFSDGTAFLRSP